MVRGEVYGWHKVMLLFGEDAEISTLVPAGSPCHHPVAQVL